MGNIMVPVGEENFECLRTSGCYYVDKTKFIVELLRERFKVNLITRPRRFGKTLTLSMLKNFFDIRKDSRKLFEGLEISRHEDICAEWMNQWPVLFISLKDLSRYEFRKSYDQLAYDISSLCVEHSYLQKSDKVDEEDKERFLRLKKGTATEAEVENSLYLLSRMMYVHYGRQAILLIDEYDVPLAKANEYGYYRQMMDVIRGLMSSAFKTNDFLKFAIITGCLRIAKESIFTGVNHFIVNSIHKGRYMDALGFTEQEVMQILTDAGLSSDKDAVRKWYDGYHFGSCDIYCPWDVVNYVADHIRNRKERPANYWKDTSHNGIIKSFIGNKKMHIKEKFEVLLSGGYVKVRLCEDLTYDLMDSSEENFWSILYLAGYLTCVKPGVLTEEEQVEPGEACLTIPNEEIKTIFQDTIVEWFRDTMKATNREPLMEALWAGNDGKASEMISDILFQTISYHNYREDFYHAFLAGVFAGAGYAVESDREHGEGRPDIVIKDRDNRRVILMEVKYAKSADAMESGCQAAINQTEWRRYAEDFLDGYNTLICYGVAFYKKRCLMKISV